MIRFDEFVDNMELAIKSLFFSKNVPAQVEIREIKKSADQYVGLVARLPGERIAPVYNLSAAYADYLKGRDVKDILEDAMHVILDTVPTFDLGNLLDYEESKKKFFIKVCNAEKRADYLEGVPHTLVDNLAITYHIVIPNKEGEFASVCINDGLLKHYGVSLEKLHEDAVENAAKILPVRVVSYANFEPIAQMKEELKANGWSEDVIPCPYDLMVTNILATAGASALFYKDVLDRLAETYDGDFYIIPVSTDMVITFKDCGLEEIPLVNEVIKDVNRREVEEKCQLGSEAYHYDAEERIFERVTKYVERKHLKMEKLETKKENVSTLGNLKMKSLEVDTNVKGIEQHKRNDDLSL